MSHKIKDGAIFIADSHYNKNRTELFYFLENLPKNTPQIFLMGDIFDFLTPKITYFTIQNSALIDTINQLSKSIEIIYMEGNHDFNLEKLFPSCIVIPREKQPIIFHYQDKDILLSHGDLDMGFWYEFYTFFIRKNCFLQLLEWVDINNWFTKWVDTKLIKKKLYYQFDNFDMFAQKRIDFFKNISFDFIVEGHFHQGAIFKNYINLPTFTNHQYMVFENGKFLIQKV